MAGIIAPISSAASGSIPSNPATQVAQRESAQQSPDSSNATRLSQAAAEKRSDELAESDKKAPRVAPPRVEQTYDPSNLEEREEIKESKSEQEEQNAQEPLDVIA